GGPDVLALADLPNRKEFIYQRTQGTFKKGEPKQAKLDDAREKMERLRAAASLFSRYEKLLAEMRRYDYEDMILWVLRAFHEHPALLRNYQEQYLYFLVDEYQDTNGAQNQVLHRLVEYWDSPNLFIVGDDDQSIYEFQGARLKNIVEFYVNYRDDLKLVVLQDNYRSSQHILDTSGALILQNNLRIVNNLRELGIEKILTARHADFAEATLRPAVVEYPNRLEEEVAIVSQIERLMHEGFPLDEVAVIYAKHKQAGRLIELLEKKGIPYRTRRPVNILDLPLIQNLRLLLEYLNAEFHRPYSGEHLLFRLMHFDFFLIQPHDLARLAACLGGDGGRWTMDEELVSEELVVQQKRRRWRDAISDKTFLKRCGLRHPVALLELSKFLETMLAEYANLSAPAFIERAINRSGLLRKILGAGQWEASKEMPNPKSVAVLHTFMNFVKKETARNPRLTLSRLLDIFKSMDANGLAIELAGSGSQVAVIGRQAPTPPTPQGEQTRVQANSGRQLRIGSVGSPLGVGGVGGNGSPAQQNGNDNQQLPINNQPVNLLTAHGSKGLEFQKVFLLDCTKDAWEPGRQGGNLRFAFPDTLTLSGETDALEARRRLFYVAITRAKETLHISYAAQNEEGKELQRAIFVDEILGSGEPAAGLNLGKLEVQPGAAPVGEILEAQAALLLESQPQAAAGQENWIAELLENFRLSVSSLNKFLRCPLSFYYENVLGVPVLASEEASFGTAMHNALQRGFEKMLRSPQPHTPPAPKGEPHGTTAKGEQVRKQFPPPEEFVQYFEQEMQKLQGFFSRKEYGRRLALGRQYLQAYVERNACRWQENVLVEQEFRNVVVEGVPLTGKIDRLDLGGSGSLVSSPSGEVGGEGVEPWGASLEAHLVDYKTGSHDPSKLKRPVAPDPKTEAIEPPNSSLIPHPSSLGGAYWRQLVFYKILFENWRNNPRRVTSAEISYLEPDAKGEFPSKIIAFEPGDVPFLKKLIRETYDKIMRQEFYLGCGEASCAWCSFLLRQGQVDSFAEVENVRLDD
ncbi:MAG: ATP-dependent DNA helicase, partial [Bacteroidota bacterium]